MRQRNAVGVFDTPLWRDWLVWLTLAAVAAGGQMVGRDYRGEEVDLAAAFDLVLSCGFQFLLFGIGVGIQRRRWRERRA